jgi:hypothetical protein
MKKPDSHPYLPETETLLGWDSEMMLKLMIKALEFQCNSEEKSPVAVTVIG